jgi:hypothetical protein
MTNQEVIASETLWGQRPGEDPFIIAIEIRKPFAWGGSSPTEWACAVKVGNLYSQTVHGEGALQALCLASQMIRSMLSNFLEEGGSLTYEQGEAFDLKSFWPPNPY